MFDWEQDSVTYADILNHFFAGVSDEYEYIASIEPHKLHSIIKNMLETNSQDDANIINLIGLDSLGITGPKLIKLWELCNKKSDYFRKTVGYITGTYLSKCFTPAEVKANLNLSKPVPFIPDAELVIDFHVLNSRVSRGSITYEDYDKIIYSLRSSLVERYNEQLLKRNLNYPKLPEPILEMSSSVEDKTLADTIEVKLNNLYFGITSRDLTGGVLSLRFDVYDIYEKSLNTIKIGGKNLYLFKNIPSGEEILVDEDGLLYKFDKEISNEELTLLPNKSIMSVAIAPIELIVEDAKECSPKLELITNYENLKNTNVTVGNCLNIKDSLIKAYNDLYGGLEQNRKIR